MKKFWSNKKLLVTCCSIVSAGLFTIGLANPQPVQARDLLPNTTTTNSNQHLIGMDGSCQWDYDPSSKTLTFRPQKPNASLSSTPITKLNSQFKELKQINFTHPVNLAKNSQSKFKDLTKLENIQGLNLVNTGNVTNMMAMFEYDHNLTKLDLSNFNTKKVTNMNAMFASMERLTELNVNKFDTSNVTNMNYMFEGLSKVTSLDLSNFDTGKVTSMSGMFARDSELTKLDLRSFNTINVQDMDYMFSDLTKIKSLNLASFNTSNAVDLSYMFLDDTNLTSLDLSNFDTTQAAKYDLRTLGILANCGNPEGFVLKLGNHRLRKSAFIGNKMTQIRAIGNGELDHPQGATYSLKQFQNLYNQAAKNCPTDTYIMSKGKIVNFKQKPLAIVDRTTKHNAYLYDRTGLRVNQITIQADSKVATYDSAVINGKKFYYMGNGLYIANDDIGTTTKGNGNLLVNGKAVAQTTLTDQNDLPTSIVVFKPNKTISSAIIKNKNGQNYYEADAEHIIPADRYATTKRKLIHNAYLYAPNGKRIGKKVLKRKQVYSTYGNAVLIGKHYYYFLGNNQYVKAANF
ncbi:BspA family leucine-rich repeat surface protein [Lactobacillus sp. ESL0684]|uniref:BspA family leucine-rich repeat surface protein n=1 Tax=Lactobacillus sp. ESL0684 TaxID=2983213 RepID=UPI0023F9AC8D|nr:BspA family leucine-rich repeat surface protein [Lactobacillus sp. ESL0684]WEV43586.1 BspA family leucine-rich repeat surface protein [Lactobacillus sp. ESL0684]